jgi:hypothetical protein
MKAKFFYQVRGTMFRDQNDQTNLIEVDEIFKDDNPILAREQAFNFYQNFIDVFLESRGEVYTSHEEAVIVLQDFMNSYKREYFKIGNEKVLELHTDFGKGLNICLVMANSKIITTPDGSKFYEDDHLIHYIDNEFDDLKMNVLDELAFEYALYAKYKYDCKNYKKDYDVSGPLEAPKLKSTLITPIDFDKVLSARSYKIT